MISTQGCKISAFSFLPLGLKAQRVIAIMVAGGRAVGRAGGRAACRFSVVPVFLRDGFSDRRKNSYLVKVGLLKPLCTLKMCY